MDGYVDKSEPRFGPGWVEFPIRSTVLHAVIRMQKFDVPFYDYAGAMPDQNLSLGRYYEELTEITRTIYKKSLKKKHVSPNATQRREMARASR